MLYLLTGLRKEELLAAQWNDISPDKTEIVISDTKNGKKHHLPLSTSAAAILAAIPRIVGKIKGKHLINIDKPWQRVRKKAGMEDVRLHDLRRTVRSWMAQSGNSLHLIGKVLTITQHTCAKQKHPSQTAPDANAPANTKQPRKLKRRTSVRPAEA